MKTAVIAFVLTISKDISRNFLPRKEPSSFGALHGGFLSLNVIY